jgi:hypothetical protein
MWDSQLIRETFYDENAQLILAIPLHGNQRDFIAWHADPKGIFSVKTAYAVGVRVRDKVNHRDQSTSDIGDKPTIWSKIWGLQVTNKIKTFLWRFTHNCLPIQTKLVRKGVKRTLGVQCAYDKDCGHLFSSASWLMNYGNSLILRN